MKRAFLTAALVIIMTGAAAAQFGVRRLRLPAARPLLLPDKDTFGDGFTFCRGIYTSDRREAGGQGWSTDYPDGETNFEIRLSELTQGPRQVRRRARASSRHRPAHRSGVDAVRLPPHGRRRHRQLHQRRGRRAARVPAQGRVPVDRRRVGLAGVGAVDRADAAGAARAAVRVSRPAARSSAVPDAVRREGRAADPVDPALAPVSAAPARRRPSAAKTAPCR